MQKMNQADSQEKFFPLGFQKSNKLNPRIEKLSEEETKSEHIVAEGFIRCGDHQKLERIRFKGVFLTEEGELPIERMSFANTSKIYTLSAKKCL